MPYQWSETEAQATLTLWPHQSMTPGGFSWFIGSTALLLTLPLFAVLGSAVAWVLMAFFAAAIWGVWKAIMANKRDRSLHEELHLTDTRVDLTHTPVNGAPKAWEANPHWVTVNLRNDGPVEKYLTLRGNGREVELGSFLTPEEREGLYEDLSRRLARR